MSEFTAGIAIAAGIFGVLVSALKEWLLASKKQNITISLKSGGRQITINTKALSEGDLAKIVSLLKEPEDKAE